jgi:putative transposase
MLLTKKIKLEVSKPDAATLEFMQGKCRGLYNWWVGRLRNGEKWSLYSAKKSLQASRKYDPELNAVYGKLLHEVYFRLDKAMQAFFRRLKAGEKPGFPRFKPRHAFFTLCYPAMYIRVEANHLILPTGGKGKARDGITDSSIRFAPSETAARKGRDAISISLRSIDVSQRRNATNSAIVCIRPRI